MLFRLGIIRFFLSLLAIAAVIGAAVGVAILSPPQYRTMPMLVFYIAAVSLFLTLISDFLRRRQWISPISLLDAAAARMSRGEWNVRVQPRGSIGVRQMAINLNLLAGQAQRQLSDLQEQRSGLQTLVDALPDPILAVDAQGRIILLNAPAARLLSLSPEQVLQQKLVSVVNDEQIVELYESLLAHPNIKTDNEPMHREIRLVRNGQRAVYQSVATRSPAGGALLVLRDISTLAGAVQMKTDFVANASHELRTPIAAIKIAFETLRDVYREDPVQSDRCISVIEGHLKRLEEMLRDLLDLSRVESADLNPHVADVKSSEVLAVLKSSLGPLARQKGVELRLGAEPTTPSEFQTDSRLVNLLLKNLVENSIKFTPPGGRVTVSIALLPPAPSSDPNQGGTVRLSVSDTGIGIAPEHLDRVFERFYQVDAARSGSAGRGTGLGLAIVKHAVHAMAGTVKIDSRVGAGTTVICEFPQTPENAVTEIESEVA